MNIPYYYYKIKEITSLKRRKIELERYRNIVRYRDLERFRNIQRCRDIKRYRNTENKNAHI